MNQNCVPCSAPRLSSGFAALTRLWHRRGAALTFTAGGRTWILAPEIGPSRAVWKIRIHARLGGDDLAVFLDDAAVADWPDSGLDAHILAELPPELAGPALELACLEQVEALEAAAGEPVSLINLNLEVEETDPLARSTAPRHEFKDNLPFVLTRESREGEARIRAHGVLLASLPCLEKLAVLFVRCQPQARAPASGFSPSHFPLRDFPLAGRIALPGPELSGKALLALEPDDILLTGITFPAEKYLPVRLIFPGGLSASARLNERTLRMESVMSKDTLNPVSGEVFDEVNDAGKDTDVEAKTPAPETEKAPVFSLPPHDIPIRLEFDLGGLELSLAQLAQLAPGSVLETNRDAAAPARILASGRAIGLGELVDVAGRLGVRVTDLYLRNNNAPV
jgi:type III secretion system YscQ/HrcQ family protein